MPERACQYVFFTFEILMQSAVEVKANACPLTQQSRTIVIAEQALAM